MGNDLYSQIAENIKKYRKLNHLTQQAMAKLLNIDYQYYAQMERGIRNFNLERVIDTCNVLHVSFDDIIPTSLVSVDDKIDKAQLLGNISQKLSKASTKDLLIVDRFIDDFITIL